MDGIDEIERELYIEIGRGLDAESLGSSRRSLDALADDGKAWFSARWRQIRTAVCGSKRVRQALDTGDTRELLTAIIVLVAGECPREVSAVVVATLILKLGVAQMCAEASGPAPEHAN
jgi:hypothetical protein